MSHCPTCGLTHQCICHALPQTQSQLSLALLTHNNEQHRDTNTGRFLAHSLPHCQVYPWSRTEPPKALLERIAQANNAYVLYPDDQSQSIESVLTPVQEQQGENLFILLDGTWQEAKKMLRKSAWLDALQKVHFTPKHDSSYRLRRNQESGHLCTLEVGCELLELIGEQNHSTQLRQFLQHYMDAFHADKSGHALKCK